MGIPTTVEQLVWSIGQLIMSIYAGWLGIVVLATHQVYVRIQSVITMIFFGFGLGSMAIVGKSLGADDTHQAKRTGMITGGVGLIVSIFIAGIIYFAAEPIASVFSEDPAVINLATSLIFILAVIQIPKGVNIIFSGNLRGGADLNWLMWLAIITVAIYDIMGAWFLAIYLNVGLAGFWILQGVDEATRLVLNYWRFNRGKWKKLDL